MLAPPELKKVHPLGKSPVLEDGKLKLVETGAICEYLVDKTGKLGPTNQGEGLLQYPPVHALRRRLAHAQPAADAGHEQGAADRRDCGEKGAAHGGRAPGLCGAGAGLAPPGSPAGR